MADDGEFVDAVETLSSQVSSDSSEEGEEEGPSFPARDSAQRLKSPGEATFVAPRQKVALTPRHSPMDWANLQRQSATLVTSETALERGFARYTLADIKKHNREEDCWISLSGRVYDVTRFLAYHPGGKKIVMSVAGKDATQKFMKYHAWVNAERMLDKCQVGFLVPS